MRFRILENSDLVTPWKEITWDRHGCSGRDGSRNRGAYHIVSPRCRNVEIHGSECPPRLHHSCQLINCSEIFPEPSFGCSCHVKHSAYSSTCRFWQRPYYLFLICSMLCKDAKTVFFSENRFTIHDFDAWFPKKNSIRSRGAYRHVCFATRSSYSSFQLPLRHPLPSADVSRYPYDFWPQDDHPALVDWANTL